MAAKKRRKRATSPSLSTPSPRRHGQPASPPFARKGQSVAKRGGAPSKRHDAAPARPAGRKAAGKTTVGKKADAKKPLATTRTAKKPVKGAAARSATVARSVRTSLAKPARKSNQPSSARKKVAPAATSVRPKPRAVVPPVRPKPKPRAVAPSIHKAIRRRDATGHLDPKYAADLLAQSGGHDVEGSSFVTRPRSKDDLAETFGEEFVETVTSGESHEEDAVEVPEERGGPFVESTGGTEFAEGTDESNPEGADREPFPTT